MKNLKIVHACIRYVPIKSEDICVHNIQYSVDEILPKPYVWTLDDAGHVIIQELPHRFILVFNEIVNALNNTDTPPLYMSTEQEHVGNGKIIITLRDGVGREIFRKSI